MARLCCPTCGQPFDSKQTTTLPFCCERCRLIDLGRWLSEEQRLTVVRREEEDEDNQ